MNRSWAWKMWLLWLICFQFSLLLFYWIQAMAQALSVDWGLKQSCMWLLACGFYFAVSYLRWYALPKVKQQPAKQFKLFVWALIFGLLPLLFLYAKMPSQTIVGGSWMRLSIQALLLVLTYNCLLNPAQHFFMVQGIPIGEIKLCSSPLDGSHDPPRGGSHRAVPRPSRFIRVTIIARSSYGRIDICRGSPFANHGR